MMMSAPFVMLGFAMCTYSSANHSATAADLSHFRRHRMYASTALSLLRRLLTFTSYAAMNAHVRYAAAFMVAIGAFSFGSLCTAFSAANVTSDTARAAALGTTVFMGNVGGLISTWTFLPYVQPPSAVETAAVSSSFTRSHSPASSELADLLVLRRRHAPRYLPGNAFNLAGSSIMLILSIAIWLWMRKENRAKENGRDDHYIEGKTDQEIADLNQKHPAFRFAY